MSTSQAVGAVVLGAAAFTALLYADGAHAQRSAVGNDPVGDASVADPSRDITDAGLAYNRRTGMLIGAIRLAGAPPPGGDGAFLTLAAGHTTDAGCDGHPAVGFGAYTDQRSARWLRINRPGAAATQDDASTTGAGTQVQQFEAQTGRLRGAKVDCVTVRLADPTDPARVYDTAGPFTLTPLPSLDLRVGATPRLAVGRTRTIKVTLRNPGEAPTAKVRVRAGAVRGVGVRVRPRTVKSIRPGGRRTVTIQVTAGKKAPTSIPLTVAATAGKLKAREKTTLYIRRAPKPRGGGTGGVCVSWVPDFLAGGSLGLVPCRR